jgi:hypothetical protein
MGYSSQKQMNSCAKLLRAAPPLLIPRTYRYFLIGPSIHEQNVWVIRVVRYPVLPWPPSDPPAKFLACRASLAGSARPSLHTTDRSARVLPYPVPVPHTWVRPLPPRAASRLSGLVRRLRCSSPNSLSVLASVTGRPTSVKFGHGPGPRSKCQ